MNAKLRLIEFLKTAPKSQTKTFEFVLENTTEPAAKDYIHRMRVELSRFRSALREEGKQLRPFRMLLEELTSVDNGVKIKLLYSDSPSSNRALRHVSEIFDVISTGDDTIDEKEARGLQEKDTTSARKVNLNVKTS